MPTFTNVYRDERDKVVGVVEFDNYDVRGGALEPLAGCWPACCQAAAGRLAAPARAGRPRWLPSSAVWRRPG
jgi:hypothetical protein